MSQPTNIYELLTAEEGAEHKRLKRLLERAKSPVPLSLAETAELCGISTERVRQIQRIAEYKVKREILTNHPDLLKQL